MFLRGMNLNLDKHIGEDEYEGDSESQMLTCKVKWIVRVFGDP